MELNFWQNIRSDYRRNLILFALIVASAASMWGQTYYYERIKIVTDAGVKACNDDAHYITFNGKLTSHP